MSEFYVNNELLGFTKLIETSADTLKVTLISGKIISVKSSSMKTLGIIAVREGSKTVYKMHIITQ